MNIKEFIADLRQKLQPGGTLNVVHVHVPSAASFYDAELVSKAIDELEQIMLQQASGMKDVVGPPTALQKLAIVLLTESI